MAAGPAWMEAATAQLHSRAAQMGPQDVANSLWSLAVLEGHRPQHSTQQHPHQAPHQASRATAGAHPAADTAVPPVPAGDGATSTTQSCIDALFGAYIQLIPDCDNQHLVMTLWSAVQLRVAAQAPTTQQMLMAAEIAVQQRAGTLAAKPQNAVMVLYSFAALGYKPHTHVGCSAETVCLTLWAEFEPGSVHIELQDAYYYNP